MNDYNIYIQNALNNFNEINGNYFKMSESTYISTLPSTLYQTYPYIGIYNNSGEINIKNMYITN